GIQKNDRPRLVESRFNAIHSLDRGRREPFIIVELDHLGAILRVQAVADEVYQRPTGGLELPLDLGEAGGCDRYAIEFGGDELRLFLGMWQLLPDVGVVGRNDVAVGQGQLLARADHVRRRPATDAELQAERLAPLRWSILPRAVRNHQLPR